MGDLKSWIAQGMYWLWINPDGTGERFIMAEHERGAPWNSARRQSLPCLAVKVVEVDVVVFEQTTTRNIRYSEGPAYGSKCIRPKGEGWEVFDDTSDHWTTWRRKMTP